MNTINPNPFRKIRDFGDVFNFSFAFLKENYQEILKLLLFYIAPFYLLAAIAAAYYQMESFQSLNLMAKGFFDFNFFSPAYFLSIIFSVIANILLVTNIASYITYHEANGKGNFRLIDVFNHALKSFHKLFIVLILMGIALGLYLFLFFFSRNIILIIPGVLILIPAAIYLSTSLSVLPMCYVSENLGIFEGIRRSFSLTHTAFWWTLLIIICSFLISYIASFIIMIPQLAITLTTVAEAFQDSLSSTTNYLLIIVTVVTTLISNLIYSVPYFIVFIYYYTLVEKKDTPTLLNKIENIGKE